MAQTGYQPRTTPAERRAFFEQQRRLNQLERTDVPVVVRVDSDETNFVSDKTGAANFDGALHMEIRSNGTTIGRITRATSSTAGFLTTSDADLKENFVQIDDESVQLWLELLEPKFFNYIGVPDVRHVGYSAQEVAELWPNGVANGVIRPGHGDVNDRTWDANGIETTPREVWESWMMDHSKPGPILHAIARMQARQIAELTQALARLRWEIYYTRQMTAYWQYSNTTTPPPGNGQMRTNTAVSQMYLSKIDDNGYDRALTMAFIVAATGDRPDAVRFRVRGTTGRVFDLHTNGPAIDGGTYITVPISVISGSAADKGFRVEITMLSEIWAQDPPPQPTQPPKGDPPYETTLPTP